MPLVYAKERVNQRCEHQQLYENVPLLIYEIDYDIADNADCAEYCQEKQRGDSNLDRKAKAALRLGDLHLPPILFFELFHLFLEL